MIVEHLGSGLVRDYVILDCFVHHICNCPNGKCLQSRNCRTHRVTGVHNHVITELKPVERVENYVIAECTGVTGVYSHEIARVG